MIKAAIVLVHGMGKHAPGWSTEMQGVLGCTLQTLNIQPSFFEPIYSDIIENALATAAFTEIEILLNLARLDTAMNLVEAGTAAEDIEVAGFVPDGKKLLRDLNRYVAGYLWRPEIKAEVDNCILSALRDAANEIGTGRIILIGHSLGSVISWSLAPDAKSSIGKPLYKLITLGSPLGWLQFAGVIKPKKVPCSWANVVAPGDIVSWREVKAPPFASDKGLVGLRVRRVKSGCHSSLVENAKVITDWLPLLV